MDMSDSQRLALADKFLTEADRITSSYGYSDSDLIGMLLDVQTSFNHLPRHVLERLSADLDVPMTRIWGLATFYKAFSLTPRGRHQVRVCLGTACHVRGSKRILDGVLKELNVRPGGTTRDFRYSVDTVRCLGCCSLSPVVQIDDMVFGRLRHGDLPGVLDRFE